MFITNITFILLMLGIITPTTPNCTDFNCQTCLDSSICTQCLPTFYLQSSSCISCNLNYDYCLACNNLTCTQCSDVFSLPLDSNRTDFDCNMNCDGYFFSQKSQKCERCGLNTNYPFCATCNTLNCFNCIDNYILNSTQYCNLNCNIKNCDTCSSNLTCLKCLPRYYQSSQQTLCLACSNALTSSACKQIACIDFFFNPISGKCLLCNKFYSSGCRTCNQVLCLTCVSGSTLNDKNICTPDCEIKNCQVCLNSMTCGQCSNLNSKISAFGLNSSQLECLPCYGNMDEIVCGSCLGFVYVSAESSCAVCFELFVHCYTCSEFACFTCFQNYVLASNRLSCAPNCSIIEHCVNCYDPAYCYECQKGYLLSSDSSCYQCDDNSYLDLLLNYCVSCANQYGDTCLTCDQYVCYSCKINYVLTKDLQKGSFCIKSDCLLPNCQICKPSNPASCQHCNDQYVLELSATNQYSCVSSSCSVSNCLICQKDHLSCILCAYSYALSIDSLNCTLICDDSFCQNCKISSICSNCNDGYSLDDSGSCSLVCSDSNCKSCSAFASCQICKDGYAPDISSTFCILQDICGISDCLICSKDGIECVVCMTGFRLSASSERCEQDICFVEYCAQCLDLFLCKRCYLQFVEDGSGGCQAICSKSTKECLFCWNETTCRSCKAGFRIDIQNNQTSCVKQCDIINCNICLDAFHCAACAQDYQLTFDSKSCQVLCDHPDCTACHPPHNCIKCATLHLLHGTCTSLCPTGMYYPSNSTNPTSVCKSCSVIEDCLSCIDLNGSLICNKCYEGFYLTVAGQCVACSSAIQKCIYCASPTICTLCSKGYGVSNNFLCISTPICMDPLCSICNQTNFNCLVCLKNYQLNSLTHTCQEPFCEISSQFFDGQSCACNSGTFLKRTACYACFDHCSTCINQTHCINCKYGFFLNNSVCVFCLPSCDICTSSTNCLLCQAGYGLKNEGQGKLSCIPTIANSGFANILTNDNTFHQVLCPPGCLLCDFQSGKFSCYSPADGYVLALGNVIKCSNHCKTCRPKQLSHCLSCSDGYYLDQNNNGSCQPCLAVNCISCPFDPRYCLKCKIGFTNNRGVCQACTPFCQTCNNQGPGTCDVGKCFLGFVRLFGNNTCISCLVGCSICSMTDLSSCQRCGPRFYLDFNQKCQSCSAGCYTCQNDSICEICDNGFQKSEEHFCFADNPFPCKKSLKNTCIQCIYGYKLNNISLCVPISLNGLAQAIFILTSGIVSVAPPICTTGQYLNSSGFCANCPSSLLNCYFCDSTNNSQCVSCTEGYFIDFNALCQRCASGCSICTSPTNCKKSQDGYFLEVSSTKLVGVVNKCASICFTCEIYSINCIQCSKGFSFRGSKCVYDLNLDLKLSFTPNSGNWYDSNANEGLKKAMVYRNLWRFNHSLCLYFKCVRNDQITFNGFAFNSIILNVTLCGDGLNQTTLYDLTKNSNVNSFFGFGLNTIDVSVNGFTPPAAEATPTLNFYNLGVILGISIPIVLICTFLFIKLSSLLMC